MSTVCAALAVLAVLDTPTRAGTVAAAAATTVHAIDHVADGLPGYAVQP